MPQISPDDVKIPQKGTGSSRPFDMNAADNSAQRRKKLALERAERAAAELEAKRRAEAEAAALEAKTRADEEAAALEAKIRAEEEAVAEVVRRDAEKAEEEKRMKQVAENERIAAINKQKQEREAAILAEKNERARRVEIEREYNARASAEVAAERERKLKAEETAMQEKASISKVNTFTQDKQAKVGNTEREDETGNGTELFDSNDPEMEGTAVSVSSFDSSHGSVGIDINGRRKTSVMDTELSVQDKATHINVFGPKETFDFSGVAVDGRNRRNFECPRPLMTDT